MVIELIGRINKCGVISPRFDIKLKSIEQWMSNLLPSRQFGYIVLTTSLGIMDQEEVLPVAHATDHQPHMRANDHEPTAHIVVLLPHSQNALLCVPGVLARSCTHAALFGCLVESDCCEFCCG